MTSQRAVVTRKVGLGEQREPRVGVVSCMQIEAHWKDSTGHACATWAVLLGR